MYEYRATISKIVDGDTVHAVLDLGCDVRISLTLRFYGINAPEIATAAGKAARAHLESLMPVGSVVTVNTIKDKREKYGRYLAVMTYSGININERMVADGHAVSYMT